MGHLRQTTGTFQQHSSALAATCLCLIATQGAARAQVLEIGDDGAARQIGQGWSASVATTPSSRTSGPPPAFRAAIAAAAARYELSPDFLDAVARSESGYDPDIVSPAGAIGVMQLMPATARQLGVDPRDPAQNIMGGAAYLRAQLDKFDGAVDLALAAYNAGSGRVVQYGGVPPFRETRAYVAANLDRLATTGLANSSSLQTSGDRP
jgi:soluble lytic murein transglycosylase-like protein